MEPIESDKESAVHSRDNSSRHYHRRSDYEKDVYRLKRNEKFERRNTSPTFQESTEFQGIPPRFTDAKLSSLVKKLVKDDDLDRRFDTVSELINYLQDKNNFKTIYKSGEHMLPSLIEIFFERTSKDLKYEISICIGQLGIIITHESKSQRFFDWLLLKLLSSYKDDVKVYLTRSLIYILKQEEYKLILSSFIPNIMIKCQNILENVNSTDMLEFMTNAIVLIAKLYPTSFKKHFRDTVDILVGWHIDSSQKSYVIDLTAEALISFNIFWSADLPFTFNLLEQFLEDLDAYIEDMLFIMGNNKDGETEAVNPAECSTKIIALLRVFTTVIKCLGESSPVESHYLLEKFNKILKTISKIYSLKYDSKLLIYANRCMQSIMVKLGIMCPDNEVLLFSFVEHQALEILDYQEGKYNASLLNLLATIFDVLNTRLSVDFLSKVLGHLSIIPKFASTSSSQTMNALLSMYSNVMSIKNVSLLQAAYKLVLSHLEVAYNILLNESGSEVICSLVDGENEFSGFNYKLMDAETVVNCHLTILLEVGNAKNNLIVMWALSPNIFTLFSDCLKPSNDSLINMFPNIHYAIIHALFSHCSKHDNFLVNSHYVLSNILDSTQPNSKHLSKIFNLLSSLISNPSLPINTRCLCLNWCLELIQQIKVVKEIYFSKDFLVLLHIIIHNGFSPQKDVSLHAGLCLLSYFQLDHQIDEEVLNNCLELCSLKLKYKDESIKKTFSDLLQYFPLHIISNTGIQTYSFVDFGNLNTTCEGYVMIYRNVFQTYMARSPTYDFQANNFAIIMTYILDEFPQNQTWSIDWLENQFFSCHRIEIDSIGDPTHDHLPNIIEGNNNLLWLWGTWEAARFCVSSRLKTPLGKPLDTFVTFEEIIKKYNSDNCLSIMCSKDEIYKHLIKPNLLLNFIEQLEKHLYNAYEGCSSAISAPSKVCKTFFRTNKTTCIDWLCRIRMQLIQLATKCGDEAAVIRHSFQLLRDLSDAKAPNYEIEQVLIYAVRGLCSFRAVEALQGLHVWARDVTGKNLSWIKIFIELSLGRLENSIQLIGSRNCNDAPTDDVSSPLRSASKSSISKTETTTISNQLLNTFLQHQAIDCCMKLGSWEEAELLNESANSNPLPSIHHFLFHPTSIDYIRASHSFSKFNFEDAELNLSNSYPNLFKNNQILVSANESIASIAQQANAMFMYALAILKERTEKNLLFAKDYLGKSLMILENILSITTSCSPIKFYQNYLIQFVHTKTILENLNKQPDYSTFPLLIEIDLFDASKHNVNDLLTNQRFLKTHRHLMQSDNKTETDFKEKETLLELCIFRLARKQKNFNICKKIFKDSNFINLNEFSNDEDNMFKSFKSLDLNTNSNLLNQVEMERQSAKLLHGIGKPWEAMESMLNTYTKANKYLHNLTGLSKKEVDGIKELNARSWLNILKWMQIGLAAKKSAEDISFINKLKDVIDKVEEPNKNIYQFEQSELETLMERILLLSTSECPSLSKTWFTLANWCYKWGHKSVDYSINGSVELSAEELDEVHQLLPSETEEDDRKQVISILTKVHMPSTDAEEDIQEHEQENSDEGLNNVRRQLIVTCPQLHYSPNLEKLLLIWRTVVQRVYHYYKLSASAYFNYLKLNDQETNKLNEDGNTTATLRLLRLLVKHAWELRHVLENGLADCPPQPWIGIIPQLFSRLNHPESYVRQSVSDLLCRVGAESPHLIVYTAVVGCIPGGRQMLKEESNKSVLLNECLKMEELPTLDLMGEIEPIATQDAEANSQEEDGEEGDDKNINMLQNRFSIILNTLQTLNPRLVSEVQLLVNELRRITLLWDELWYGSINQMYADVNRRIKQLETEVKKAVDNRDLNVEENKALILKKHLTVLRPTLFTLEKLKDLTNGNAETPHEKNFQETFMKPITELIEAIKNPTNPKNPNLIWNLFKQLHHDLQQKSQKKSDQFLNIDGVSTKLAQLKSTVITMPGLSNNREIVTIESIHNIVQILPTKTRPKKMIFMGSDGIRYPYLFKGLEDLHLDERIMQFLSIVNNMLAKSKKKKVPTATLR